MLLRSFSAHALVAVPRCGLVAMLILLAAPEAHAYAVAICAPLAVTGTVPSPGQVTVPIDAPIRAVVGGRDTCAFAEYTLSLSRSDDGTEVASERMPAADAEDDGLLTLPLDGPLEPDTGYTLTVTNEGFAGEASEIAFTTGSGTAVGMSGEPTFSADALDWDREFGATTLTWSAEAADDPDHLSVMQVRVTNNVDAVTMRSAVVADDGTVSAESSSWNLGGPTDRLCAQVRQLDGTGTVTDWSDESCVSRGCSSAGTPASVGALLLALPFLRRRT